MLKNERWCLLKRPENLTDKQKRQSARVAGLQLEKRSSVFVEERVPAVLALSVVNIASKT